VLDINKEDALTQQTRLVDMQAEDLPYKNMATIRIT